MTLHKLFTEENNAYDAVIMNESTSISIEEQIMTFVYISEYYSDMLSESLMEEGIKEFAKKLGLHVHKGKGLIDYFKQFTTGIGKLFMYLIKGNNEAAKEHVKSVKKEDIIHFLLQLDQATLHLITGPIHALDAITGWHIGANLDVMKKKASETLHDVIKRVKDAFVVIKQHVSKSTKLSNKKSQKVYQQVDRIEKLVVEESILTEGITKYYIVKWDKNHAPIALFGADKLDTIWYKTIQFMGGYPIDTTGTKIDSISGITNRLSDSPNKIVPIDFDKYTGEAYRKGKFGYAVMITTNKLKKDKNYEEIK